MNSRGLSPTSPPTPHPACDSHRSWVSVARIPQLAQRLSGVRASALFFSGSGTTVGSSNSEPRSMSKIRITCDMCSRDEEARPLSTCHPLPPPLPRYCFLVAYRGRYIYRCFRSKKLPIVCGDVALCTCPLIGLLHRCLQLCTNCCCPSWEGDSMII